MLTHVLITDAHRRLVSILQAYWRCWRRKLCQQNDSERAGGRLKQRHGGNEESCVLDCRRSSMIADDRFARQTPVWIQRKSKNTLMALFFFGSSVLARSNLSLFFATQTQYSLSRDTYAPAYEHTLECLSQPYILTPTAYLIYRKTLKPPQPLPFLPLHPCCCWYFFFG